VTVKVLTNDRDPDADVLNIVSVTQPQRGFVDSRNDTSIKYSPNNGFTGMDSFTYKIADGNGAFDTAIVTVAVVGTGSPLEYNIQSVSQPEVAVVVMLPHPV
jgi:hypothetical protein